MKLANLYSSAPNRRLGVGSTQFGSQKTLPSAGMRSIYPLRTPFDKGKSIMGRKRTYPGSE
jgi:hypothetical protein